MKKYFFFGLLLASLSKPILAQETLADKVNHAFSLVGHWEITRMDVIKASTTTNPSTVPEAALGKVTIRVQSELGSYGSFDIAPGGSISGGGEAQYTYLVSAGSTAFSFSGITFPVGASALMNGDNGVRKFSISGSADLTSRTIKLNAFTAEGGGLKMIIHPSNSTFTSPLWPPMTNVESKVIVTGASLLLRATGVLSGIKVSFEAVKYVDLASLFTAIENVVKNGTNGNNGNNGTNGNNGGNGTNGTNGTNTNTNGAGGQALVAGTVTVEMGGSANVVFKKPQASANYAISLTPMGGSANSSPVATFSNKTNLGFKINLAKNGAAGGPVKIDWLVTPYTN